MSVADATLSTTALKPPKKGALLLAPIQILDADGTYTADGGLYIDNGRIADRGTAAAMKQQYAQVYAVAAAEFLVTPGLINAHTHAAMGFFRDLGHAVPKPGVNQSMIETFLFPAEKSLTADLLEPLSYSYLLSGLRSGVTTFVDHYYFVDGVGQAIERLGMRGVIGETVADLGGAFPSEATWQRARKSLDNWKFGARVLPAIAPHATDTVSEKLLKELGSYAVRNNLPIHMHLSQTAGERQRVSDRFGMSPVAFAAKFGVLTDRTLAVHLITADKTDVKLLSQHGVTAGFCPTSQILYEALAPIQDLLAGGVAIALGTDCAASNDSADMLTEMKIGALCAIDRGKKLPSKDVLAWATTNPARALYGKSATAPLQKGAAADLVIMKPDLGTLPLQEVATNLIFSMGSAQVRHVMIDGTWVLWNQQPTLVSEADMQSAYLTAVATIKQRTART